MFIQLLVFKIDNMLGVIQMNSLIILHLDIMEEIYC